MMNTYGDNYIYQICDMHGVNTRDIKLSRGKIKYLYILLQIDAYGSREDRVG